MIELVNAFLSGGADTVQELRAAVELGDAEAIARAAHKLKGAAANLHVNNLATQAFDLETRAKSGQKADCRADVEKIAAEFARVGENLRTEFGLEEPAVRPASLRRANAPARARPTAIRTAAAS